jgi:hypothetical protein
LTYRIFVAVLTVDVRHQRLQVLVANERLVQPVAAVGVDAEDLIAVFLGLGLQVLIPAGASPESRR